MSRRPLRRSGLLVCAAVVGSFLPLFVSSPAAAAAEGDYTSRLVLTDSNNDGFYGVYPVGSAVLGESTTRDVEELESSVDSARLITTETTYTAAGLPTVTRIVVHDADSQGTVVRVVDSMSADADGFLFGGTISADGNRASWTRATFTETDLMMQSKEIDLATGATRVLPVDSVAVGYLDSSTVLLQDTTDNSFAASTPNGTVTAVTGIPADAFDIRTNPAGTRLTWALDTSTDATLTSDIQVAAWDRATLAASSVVTVATGQQNESPIFTLENAEATEVRFVKWDGGAGNGNIYWVVVDDTPEAFPDNTTADDELRLSPIRFNQVAPAIATAQPAQLLGTSAKVFWSLPSDTDLSGVLVYRFLGDEMTYQQKTVFVPAPATSFTDTGLVLGQTYRYMIVAKDRSGNGASGEASNRRLTAAAAAPTFQDPTSRTTVRAPFPVRFATSAASTVKYTVDFTINGGGYRPWVANVAGVQRTFGAPAATGVAATMSTPGQTYRFRVVANDAYGNSTAPVLSGKAVVPFDQTKAALSGGANVGRGDSWMGTLRTLNRTSHYARIAITGDRFQLIVERCTTCGVVDIYDGSTRIASVDTRAAARQARQVVYTKTWAAAGNHTITVRPRATAGRPNVILDGFAVRR